MLLEAALRIRADAGIKRIIIATNDVDPPIRFRLLFLSSAVRHRVRALTSFRLMSAVYTAPFMGGIKRSGLRREGSSAGIEKFTELKYVCIEV